MKIYLTYKKFFNIIFVLYFVFILTLTGNTSYFHSNNQCFQIHDSTMTHRQHMIHTKSPMVMPFDMDKVTHYFLKTETGGNLLIKVKDKKDTMQIALVRNHLKKEQTLFLNSNFKDPQTLHGIDMPGLKILTNSKGKFDVIYNELPEGAELMFESKDSLVIDAIHKWFDAQLSDHGNDVKRRID